MHYININDTLLPSRRVFDSNVASVRWPDLDLTDANVLNDLGIAVVMETNERDEQNIGLIVDKINGQWVGTWSTATDLENLDAKHAAIGVARVRRANLLAKSDWTQIPDSPLSTEVREQWATYRQALRDITTQEGFPLNITWPQAPN